MKIVPEHIQVERQTVVEFFPDHEQRTESAEFRKTKKELHEAKTPCWINNGYCKGNLEVHHDIVEYSDNNAVDWDLVRKDHPNVTDVDCKSQMLVLCEKHHRSPFHGIHHMDKPTWLLQRYAKPVYLARWEKAIDEQIKKMEEKNDNT